MNGLFEVNIHTYPALLALVTTEVYSINHLLQGEQRCFSDNDKFPLLRDIL